VYVKPEDREVGMDLYVTHFATCPEAAHFRKDR